MLHCALLHLLHVHVHCVYHVTCTYGTKRRMNKKKGNIEILKLKMLTSGFLYTSTNLHSKNTQNIRAGSEITANYMKVHVLQLKHTC